MCFPLAYPARVCDRTLAAFEEYRIERDKLKGLEPGSITYYDPNPTREKSRPLVTRWGPGGSLEVADLGVNNWREVQTQNFECRCLYCGTTRENKTHNCRNCAGLEVV